MTIASARPLHELTEKEWDAQLFNSRKGLATTLGWTLIYHTLRSKGSQPDFPDRVLVRDRVIFAELKREGEKPADRQQAWLTGLARAGAEAYMWRPSDLDEIGRVLSKRWDFTPFGLIAGRDVTRHWIPASLWLPAGHRADAAAKAEPQAEVQTRLLVEGEAR